MRALRQQEDLAAMIASYSQTKQSVDNYATVLSCLIEFQSIEQALALQVEKDRNKMQLLGKHPIAKAPEEALSP